VTVGLLTQNLRNAAWAALAMTLAVAAAVRLARTVLAARSR